MAEDLGRSIEDTLLAPQSTAASDDVAVDGPLLLSEGVIADHDYPTESTSNRGPSPSAR